MSSVARRVVFSGRVQGVGFRMTPASWMLQGAEASARGVVPILRISTPTPAMEMVLDLIARSGADFDGGMTFTEAEAWVKRQKNHVCGTVDIDFVHFLDRVVRS